MYTEADINVEVNVPNKRDTSPPKPYILGTGAANKAAKALKGRKSRLEAAEAAALDKKRKK